MLTILNKYPFAIAVGMPTLAVLGLTIALFVVSAMQSNWAIFGGGILSSLFTLYLGLRTYEYYQDARKVDTG